MAFNNNISVSPIKFGDVDVTFDEKGSTFLAFRKIQWCKEGETPDESLAKLELRKWRVQSDGTERADKGFSFLTPEGPHELAVALVREGYGATKDILSELRTRDNFKEAVEHFSDEEDINTSGEYFDMRSLLEEMPEDDNG
jgi:hypothetical protein